MSFMTYESARPWAKAMKAAVLSRKMPPWFADPHYGEFRNAPKLTQGELQTIAAWADNGAREGDAADMPAPAQWVDGWRIQPDVIVAMPQPYRVQAKGAGEIRRFTIPNPFFEDTWVSSIEIRPGDPSVVHHVIVQIPDQKDLFKVAFEAGVADAAKKTIILKDVVDGQQPGGFGSYNDIFAKARERQTGEGAFMTMEAVYAPGTSPLDFRYTGSAKLIRGGKPIQIEVHYTPNGKETMDQTMVGFTLAKGPSERRFVMMAPEHLIDPRRPIPAGESNYETRGELTFKQDADLVWFMPHMHLRGKDMNFTLVYPDGHEQTVLNAKFNFNWQLGYEVQEPINVPKGTRLVVTAHHDNSANNPFNPDPEKPVVWGDLTSQEMMIPWFGVVVAKDASPEMIASYRPPDLDGAASGTIRVIGRPDLPFVQPLVQPLVIRK